MHQVDEEGEGHSETREHDVESERERHLIARRHESVDCEHFHLLSTLGDFVPASFSGSISP